MDRVAMASDVGSDTDVHHGHEGQGNETGKGPLVVPCLHSGAELDVRLSASPGLQVLAERGPQLKMVP